MTKTFDCERQDALTVRDAQEVKCFRLCLEAHMNLFLSIVAPFYGLTRAEEVLGRALRSMPRDRFLVSTTVGR